MSKSKTLLAGLVSASILTGAGALTYTSYSNNIQNENDVNEETPTVVETRLEKRSKSETVFNDRLKEVMSKEIYGVDDNEIYDVDVSNYEAKHDYTIKLDLDDTVTSLKGIECLQDIRSLTIVNATNENLDWSPIKELKNLQSLTIINCKLSPSDISSCIDVCVKFGDLRQLFINAAFPGKAGSDFKGISSTEAYNYALNHLGSETTHTDTGAQHKTLRVLSLVGNDWQGTATDLDILINSGCQVALNANTSAARGELGKSIKEVY